MPSRVQDGPTVIDIEYEENTEFSPLAPTILPDDEGMIFVSIPSYRGTNKKREIKIKLLFLIIFALT